MNKNIVLIGMPGSGKSTIGKLLAEKLNMTFVDMDEMIEKNANKSIADIFKCGEEHFRNLETKMAEELGKKESLVISTGGGIVKNAKNIDCLKKNSVIIFINRSPHEIIKDIDIKNRPLLNNVENIYKLYDERINLYKKYCHIEVENNNNAQEGSEDIIKKLISQPFLSN